METMQGLNLKFNINENFNEKLDRTIKHCLDAKLLRLLRTYLAMWEGAIVPDQNT